MFKHHEIENDLVNLSNQLNKMVRLWNHGITYEELFTNTPLRISSKKSSELRRFFKTTETRDYYLSIPFSYCMALIVDDMLENSVRFRLPLIRVGYFDFDIKTGDQFIERRKKGLYTETDLIGSEFTGYKLKFYFQGISYMKEANFYMGSDYKQKFIDKINSGFKYYTLKDERKLDYYIPQIIEKFPIFREKEVFNIIRYGFSRMFKMFRYGCNANFSAVRPIKNEFFMGKFHKDKYKYIKGYMRERDAKLRMIESWKRIPFDNYYYFSLCPSKFKEFVKINHNNRGVYKIDNIVCRKIKEEMYYRGETVYMFKIKVPKFRGYAFWEENLRTRDIEYIGVCNKSFPTFENIPLKQLMKNEIGKC